MRALTIRQPWADAITHGTKRTENRTRPTRHRGPLLIHVGLAVDRDVHHPALDTTWPGTTGAIIAAAELTDCHYAADPRAAPPGARTTPGTGCSPTSAR